MAIARLGTDTSATGNALDFTFSHTLVVGNNRVVWFAYCAENSDTVDLTGVTYGGVAMTKAVDASTAASGVRNIVEIWYLLEASLPADGSNTISVDGTGTASTLEVNAMAGALSGVKQAAPEFTDGDSQTSGATITSTLSPTAGAWVVSAVTAGNVGDFAHGQSQTEILEFDDASSTFAVAVKEGAAGSETSFDSTLTGTVNRLVRCAASFAAYGPSVYVVGDKIRLNLGATVPTLNSTSWRIKAWGGGGCAGDGNTSQNGGTGGGAGFAGCDVTVTPSTNVECVVGVGGNGTTKAASGLTGCYVGSNTEANYVAIAPGGGNGGDASSTTSGGNAGGAGGPGGGTSGTAGTAGGGGSPGGAGGAGTSSAGGGAGSGSWPGSAGSSLTGGAGGANGGVTGGTGGAGKYGGGGGGAASGTSSAGGGGGGSGKTSGTNTTSTAGSGSTPGNNGDGDYRSGRGVGGAANTGTIGADGTRGWLVIEILAVYADPLLPSFLDASSTLYGPTLTSNYKLQPAFLDASSALYGPSLTHNYTLQPAFLDSSAVLYGPSLVQVLQPAFLDATSALYDPSLSNHNNLAPDFLSSGTLYGPALQYEQFLQPAFLDSSAVLYGPTLTFEQFLEPAFLDASSAVYEPALSNNYKLQPAFLDATSELFEPSIALSFTIQPELLSSGTLYNPTLVYPQTLEPAFLSSGTLYEPKISQTLSPQFLRATSVIYAPHLKQQGKIKPDFLSSGTVFEPILLADSSAEAEAAAEAALIAENALPPEAEPFPRERIQPPRALTRWQTDSAPALAEQLHLFEQSTYRIVGEAANRAVTPGTDDPITVGGVNGPGSGPKLAAFDHKHDLGVYAGEVESASELDLGALEGDYCTVSGSTSITRLGKTGDAGLFRTTLFSGALTLVHSTHLLLLGSVNIDVVAGVVASWRKEEGYNTWRLVSILQDDSLEPGDPNEVLTTNASGELEWKLISNDNIAANAEIEVSKLKDGAANEVLVTAPDGTTVQWDHILNANIDPAAGIVETKLATGSADEVLTTNAAGTANDWRKIVNANVDTNAEIEISKLKDGAANEVAVTASDGTTVQWSLISNANVASNAAIVVTKLAPDTSSNTVLQTNAGATAVEWQHIYDANVADDAWIQITKLQDASNYSVIGHTGSGVQGWKTEPRVVAATVNEDLKLLTSTTPAGTSGTSKLRRIADAVGTELQLIKADSDLFGIDSESETPGGLSTQKLLHRRIRKTYDFRITTATQTTFWLADYPPWGMALGGHSGPINVRGTVTMGAVTAGTGSKYCTLEFGLYWTNGSTVDVSSATLHGNGITIVDNGSDASFIVHSGGKTQYQIVIEAEILLSEVPT